MFIKVYNYDYRTRTLSDNGFYLSTDKIVFIVTKPIDNSFTVPLIHNGKCYWPISITYPGTVGVYFITDEDCKKLLNIQTVNMRS